jgi:glycosyltransferase involved in cell wall biosynthesis
MRVALVHDHLNQNGGAERVLLSLQALWPDAPTFTLVYDEKAFGTMFAGKDIRTSFLQHIPFSKKLFRYLLPLMPTATESYDLSEFDVVISSTSAFAKGIIPPPYGIHISYCHTPTRYLWTDAHSYVKELRAPRIVKWLLPLIQTQLRAWDQLAAQRVDHFIANSQTVEHRIKRYYQRDSIVIHPPVDTAAFTISHEPKRYFLAGGRLVSYKRFDLVVDAFNKLGRPLKIFGNGPELEALKKRAKPNIEFVGRVSNEERAELFQNAIAFIHPQEEDFGITPIESMAAGRPVIAWRRGGAVETIIDGKTGLFFDVQHWAELADTILHFDESKFKPHFIREHALTFDTEVFHKKMRALVEEKWLTHKREVLGRL